MKKISIFEWRELEPLVPAYALVAGVDLVIIPWNDEEQVSVLYGRCLHRGALMSDGHIDGENLLCGLHNWDYSYKTGVSSYNPEERLQRFTGGVEDGEVWVESQVQQGSRFFISLPSAEQSIPEELFITSGSQKAR